MRKEIFITLLFLFMAGSSWAEKFRDSLVVYYAEGVTDIDMNLLGNRKNINSFLSRYDLIRQNPTTVIRSFRFDAFASPTSSLQTNILIARKRAQKLYEFFRRTVGLPESVVEVTSHDVDWNELRRQVEKSDMPHKYEVLCILILPPKKVTDGKGRRVDHRKLMLMRMHSGMTWRYLYEHFFQAMRYARVCIHFEMERGAMPVLVMRPSQGAASPPQAANKTAAPANDKKESAIVLPHYKKGRFYGFVSEKKIFFADTLPLKTIQKVGRVVEDSRQPLPKRELARILRQQRKSEPKVYEKRKYFALKTNVLFDALSVLNASVEVPLGRHWSVEGEYMFPWWFSNGKRNTWWLWDHGQNAVQIISGSLEPRYWLDQYNSHKAYTPHRGWFFGVFGGGGYYDLEQSRKGYQGEFWMAGISGGYVKQLTRQWLLEFSIATGYLQTNYRYYNAMWNELDQRYHLVRQSNGSTSWFGPLKARVSLVWYPTFRKRVRDRDYVSGNEKGGNE